METCSPLEPAPDPAQVLVVDDDRDVCDLVVEVFEHIAGITVTACTDPRDALEHIGHRPVDVVLTDLYMGRFSGMDILEAAQQHHPDAVVILMTGQPSIENALAAMRQGAYDYLLKPFDIHTLRHTVERGIERRRLWLENAHLKEVITLYQLSCAATGHATLEDLFRLALNALESEFDPELLSIFVAPRGDLLEPAASRGEPQGDREAAFSGARDAQSAEAFQGAAPVVAAVPPETRLRTDVAGPVLKATRIAYPIQIGRRVLGLINIQCPPRPEPINAGDLKTLSILSAQLGAALENRWLLDRLQSAYVDMVHALASALDARDQTTRDHTDRVCHLAEAIAREMNWPEEKMPDLWLGCILHDIGKIAVPDTILHKPGPLSQEEFEQMKHHTLRGARMVEAIPYLQKALPYILHHHEKFDGSGYPHGLKGEDIPVEARLLAVVDTFDAIISDRPYRKGRSIAVALAEIQAYRGTQFDPAVVDAFMRAWSRGLINPRLLQSSPGDRPKRLSGLRLQPV